MILTVSLISSILKGDNGLIEGNGAIFDILVDKNTFSLGILRYLDQLNVNL